MQLGIFAKTFVRPTLEPVFDAVASHGLHCMQFNFSCAGLETVPASIDAELCTRIRRAAEQRKIAIAAVSGTFNLIHPDRHRRREGLARLRPLAVACTQLGAPVITLCTGTRDPHDMWRRHPENDSPEAWDDLSASLREALTQTADTNVLLAFEPEVANVIDSAAKARRLLDELASDRLKVVFDGANLFHSGDLPRMRAVLREAINLLSTEIVIAHAKDLSHDGGAGHEAAGTGLLDYDYYLGTLRGAGFDGPLILHGLSESQVPQSVAFLQNALERIERDSVEPKTRTH